MSRIIGAGRYLAFIGVVSALVASAVGFGWGGYKTYALVRRLIDGDVDHMAVGLVQVMDAFLIAAGLLILALGLHELFVGAIELPSWLVIHDLDSLKGKMAGIVTMVMAVSFLERLETGDNARDVLYIGVAVAVVTAALVAFLRRKGAGED